jgi:hypothetical protein
MTAAGSRPGAATPVATSTGRYRIALPEALQAAAGLASSTRCPPRPHPAFRTNSPSIHYQVNRGADMGRYLSSRRG